MFLKSDNKLKTKLLAYATVVTAGLIAAGMLWFDKPLFVLLLADNLQQKQTMYMFLAPNLRTHSAHHYQLSSLVLYY